MHRFYLLHRLWGVPPYILEGSEADHALNVLRLKVGDHVILFDGQGVEAKAAIQQADRHTLTLAPLVQTKTPRVSCEITLAQAIPKGKNMDFIIQKAVELGAMRIAPLISDRTIARVGAEDVEKKTAKWTAIAIEACKQCGRNWLPDILPARSISDFFENAPPSDLRLIASLQSDAKHLKKVLADYVNEYGKMPRSVIILIGPEGDFTPAEIAYAKSMDCRPITLGPIILRTETATMYCLSTLSHELFA